MSLGDTWTVRGTAARMAMAQTWSSMAEAGEGLGQSEWQRATACPGWAVKDHFSHLIGIERMLLGEATPITNEPLGDHVKNEFAASLEPWVSVRRASAGEVVRLEFIDVTAQRLVALEALSEEDWAKVGFSPAGEVPYAQFMELRVFDSWVHEQDVRTALGRPGGQGGLASHLAADHVQRAMGFVVGKKAAAADGSVVRFEISGAPSDTRSFTLAVEGGRAHSTDDAVEPTVTLALSCLDFVQLGCGRTTAAQVDAAGGIGVDGDPALAQAIVNSMNFMV